MGRETDAYLKNKWREEQIQTHMCTEKEREKERERERERERKRERWGEREKERGRERGEEVCVCVCVKESWMGKRLRSGKERWRENNA